MLASASTVQIQPPELAAVALLAAGALATFSAASASVLRHSSRLQEKVLQKLTPFLGLFLNAQQGPQPTRWTGGLVSGGGWRWALRGFFSNCSFSSHFGMACSCCDERERLRSPCGIFSTTSSSSETSESALKEFFNSGMGLPCPPASRRCTAAR